jgi:hypothetical protein
VNRPTDPVVKWLTIGLTIGAFANSYRHGVSWTLSHSPEAQEPFWAWTIAALPELMIIIAVRLALRSLRDPRVWVIGGYAVGWTMWVNGASAAGGISGMVVALSPAWSALLALWALGHLGSREPVQSEPEPVQGSGSGAQTAHLSPAQGSDEPAQTAQNLREPEPIRGSKGGSKTRPAPAGTGPRARVQAWVNQQAQGGQTVTVAELRKQFPDVSPATLKRVQRPAVTGVTGSERESVNA